MRTIEKIRTKVDWPTTLIPFVLVLVLFIVFMLIPEQSKVFVDTIRGFLGDTCGLYYALFGVAVLTTTLYVAFSKYGKIKFLYDKRVRAVTGYGTLNENSLWISFVKRVRIQAKGILRIFYKKDYYKDSEDNLI